MKFTPYYDYEDDEEIELKEYVGWFDKALPAFGLPKLNFDYDPADEDLLKKSWSKLGSNIANLRDEVIKMKR